MSRKFKFTSSKEQERLKLFGAPEPIFDIDMVKGPQIEFFSNREMTLDGCFGVLEYNGEYIRLKLQRGCLILCGSDFDICRYEESVIKIKGNISTVEFCV